MGVLSVDECLLDLYVGLLTACSSIVQQPLSTYECFDLKLDSGLISMNLTCLYLSNIYFKLYPAGVREKWRIRTMGEGGTGNRSVLHCGTSTLSAWKQLWGTPCSSDRIYLVIKSMNLTVKRIYVSLPVFCLLVWIAANKQDLLAVLLSVLFLSSNLH